MVDSAKSNPLQEKMSQRLDDLQQAIANSDGTSHEKLRGTKRSYEQGLWTEFGDFTDTID